MKIAVVTNDATQPYQRQVISGIQHQLRAEIEEIVIETTGAPMAALPVTTFDGVDGVLVIANSLDDRVIRELHGARIPLSLVSHTIPDTDIPAVVPDNVGAVAQLVHFLFDELGRERIAFVMGDHTQTDGVERTGTFSAELIRAGASLDETLFLRGDFSVDVAREAVREAVATGIKFDALAAADYLMACAAVDVLRDAGVHIPDDVAVVGVGDGPEATAAGLTTAGIDVEQIGVHAARQLLAQMHGSRIRGITRISTSIVRRSSTPAPQTRD